MFLSWIGKSSALSRLRSIRTENSRHSAWPLLRSATEGATAVTPIEVPAEFKRGCVDAMARSGTNVGSIEYLIDPSSGEALYLDPNLLSTYPDVAVAGRECWFDLARSILSKARSASEPQYWQHTGSILAAFLCCYRCVFILTVTKPSISASLFAPHTNPIGNVQCNGGGHLTHPFVSADFRQHEHLLHARFDVNMSGPKHFALCLCCVCASCASYRGPSPEFWGINLG